MVPRPPPPPVHHHASLTETLSPSSARDSLDTYLAASSTKPYLHPDSLLSSTGITFSATSGATGGLALHHLRRIEAGLRGERLVAETREELDRLFGDGAEDEENRDERLDGLIAETAARNREALEGSGLKRKRKGGQDREDIEQWANETSSINGGAGQQELESFANTPMHVSDWQDQEQYELQQEMLEGEVGERDGAPVVKQNGIVPEVTGHDAQGREVTGGAKTEAEKEARRAAKKQRREEERRKKAAEMAGGQG